MSRDERILSRAIAVRFSEEQYRQIIADKERSGFRTLAVAGRTRWIQSINIPLGMRLVLAQLLQSEMTMVETMEKFLSNGRVTLPEFFEIVKRNSANRTALLQEFMARQLDTPSAVIVNED